MEKAGNLTRGAAPAAAAIAATRSSVRRVRAPGESARRWNASALSRDAEHPIEGSVCATVWPTRALNSSDRWFDELYLWTEGFQASTTQRVRIQLMGLASGFSMLEKEHADHVGVTLSFGTVERFGDAVDSIFQAHSLVHHRIVIILRGSIDRLRSRYRVRAFVDHLRAQQIPVGYRASAPRISMEMAALDFLQPDFVKIIAPGSLRPEPWEDLVLGARVAGVALDRMIVAGLESAEQLAVAAKAEFGFGQGGAVRAPYAPPAYKPQDPAIFSPPAPPKDNSTQPES